MVEEWLSQITITLLRLIAHMVEEWLPQMITFRTFSGEVLSVCASWPLALGGRIIEVNLWC
jgi:hypothetical protein